MSNAYHLKSIRIRKGAEVLFMKWISDETADTGDKTVYRSEVLKEDLIFPNYSSVFDDVLEDETPESDYNEFQEPIMDETSNQYFQFLDPDENGESYCWIRLSDDMDVCVNNEDWEESEYSHFPFDPSDDENWEEDSEDKN